MNSSCRFVPPSRRKQSPPQAGPFSQSKLSGQADLPVGRTKTCSERSAGNGLGPGSQAHSKLLLCTSPATVSAVSGAGHFINVDELAGAEGDTPESRPLKGLRGLEMGGEAVPKACPQGSSASAWSIGPAPPCPRPSPHLGAGGGALGWVGLNDQGWAVVWPGGHPGRGKSPGSRTRPGPGSQPCHPPTDCVT